LTGGGPQNVEMEIVLRSDQQGAETPDAATLAATLAADAADTSGLAAAFNAAVADSGRAYTGTVLQVSQPTTVVATETVTSTTVTTTVYIVGGPTTTRTTTVTFTLRKSVDSRSARTSALTAAHMVAATVWMFTLVWH
jgi:hypothetical protein